MTTAEDLARDLGVSGKTLRSWLRRRFPSHVHGSPWRFTSGEAAAIRSEYRSNQSGRRVGALPSTGTRSAPGGGRDASDEAYVIDLCDEVLGAAALRQWRFEWLLGDPGADGRCRRLPVDAYYPARELVVEYMERQHSEPIAHFDKPDVLTVSGVSRGEQRRLYDARRWEQIPAHGLTLVCITCDELAADPRGRLRRDRAHDLTVVRRRLGSIS